MWAWLLPNGRAFIAAEHPVAMVVMDGGGYFVMSWSLLGQRVKKRSSSSSAEFTKKPTVIVLMRRPLVFLKSGSDED